MAKADSRRSLAERGHRIYRRNMAEHKAMRATKPYMLVSLLGAIALTALPITFV